MIEVEGERIDLFKKLFCQWFYLRCAVSPPLRFIVFYPALRIVGEEIGLSLSYGIVVGNGPTTPARRPEGTGATFSLVISSVPEFPEEVGGGPDGSQGFVLQVSGNQPDPPAGHHRSIARYGDP